MLPATALALAHQRGIAVSETIAQIPVEARPVGPGRIMNHAFIPGGIQYELFGYAAEGGGWPGTFLDLGNGIDYLAARSPAGCGDRKALIHRLWPSRGPDPVSGVFGRR